MNSLYKAYLRGRMFISNKSTITFRVIKNGGDYTEYFKENPYDGRTKEGKAWLKGVCHELDAFFHIWHRIPYYGRL